MKCLLDYIGLDNCLITDSDGNKIVPDSGLFINELEGVSIESIDKLADSEQMTFLKVWADVQKRGLRKFETAITSYFRKKYKLKKLVDRVLVGTKFLDDERIPASNSIRGVLITLDPNYSEKQAEYSELIQIRLNEVYYWSAHEVNDVEFIISDPETGIVLWTKNIDLKQGKNKILPEWTASANSLPRSIGLGVDATNLETIKTEVLADGSCSCSFSFAGYLSEYSANCCEADVKGWIYDRDTNQLEETKGNLHGFQAFVSIGCSYEGLVCGSRDLFASAIWYLLGSELMSERINSPRLNKFTTIDLKKAKDLRESFKATYIEELDLAVEGIDLADCDCCLECDPLISYQETRL